MHQLAKCAACLIRDNVTLFSIIECGVLEGH